MHPVELTFYKLVSKEIELSDFENWVYTETTLEQTLNSDDYLEIISINYKTPSGLYEAQKVLSKYFSMGKYYEWSIRNILHKIIAKPDDVHKYIEQCYDLYCEGFGFMDNLGLGYGLGLTCPDGFNDKVEEFYPHITEEAERVLLWLDTGKIIITGHSGEYQGIEYDDNRSPKEKEPTGYKIQKSKKWWQFWL
ncbi:hypothetical protein [Pseudoalteromonas byunsanensis]|uniref:Uncharacterized protein n=1 Tax=Pseudoalteromonas byunsanensis TaxID=327939 RepID=A0A1S1N014_9GAMM|nr:hypothetical protein [Pseudoalteromonas byunsanensis]OHU94378.1 hypothetical protein BIW53_14970 [Pseudoalteromonas byunsanensis]